MSTNPALRERKRLATRQSISDAATRLFVERGFDRVTIDDIAAAADVGRMTVFNHFPRKEDMFYDLDEMGRADILGAIRERDPKIAPVESLRLFAHRAVHEKPYLKFSRESRAFIATINSSAPLKARAREIRDELERAVELELAASVGQKADDPDAKFAAGIIVATWAIAFVQAHHARSVAESRATFLDLVDKATLGLGTAMKGSPYV